MPEKKSTAKKAAVKKTAAKKAVASTSVKKPVTKKKAASASAGFSLEDAISVAKKRSNDDEAVAKKIAAKEKAQQAVEEAEQKTEKRVLGAASLFDILGFDPVATTTTPVETRPVAKKFKKFYELLVNLRDHVKSGLNLHTEETLKRSSKDDSGDLSSYSQHTADAGTETFDRDFALSMVSSEQDALTEIEAAIERVFAGKYGVCEMTGKHIREERLLAVPFTRYSLETQKQLEKNQTRSVQRGGIFADATSADAISSGDSDSE
jgi:RNA polymerase-binding transcription factor DksA